MTAPTPLASPPRYYSTRDPDKKLVSFDDALLNGLAPDGGLYVPDFVPTVEPIRKADTFPDLAVNVLQRWLGEDETLAQTAREALSFPVPLEPLGDGVFVLELFRGPTRSFKDFGARTMARLMSRALKKRGERVTILVATSGDTGSAVADGFAGRDNIDVVLLYPKNKVSAVQERQLIVARPGVRAYAVEGAFDDCQRLIKEAFLDPALKHVPLSSANSINIGRLLPQSLYYLWAALEVASRQGLEVASRQGLQIASNNAVPVPPVFCVPSGNLGNLTGGVLAAKMGLNVRRFIAAHNANDFFPAYLERLRDAYAFHPTVATVSNAMDVGAPSNFERLYTLLAQEELETRLWGSSVSDDATKARMKEVYEGTGYVACPHTAVGLEAAARFREKTGDANPVITLATAHPAKFPEVVGETLGIPAPKDESLEALWEQETRVEALAPTLEALREVLLYSRYLD